MKICIAGGTGLIGSEVKRLAKAAGHSVTVVHVPRPAKARAHLPEAWTDVLDLWQPVTFSGYDVLMFFGGESITSRWSYKKRQRIELSRQMPCRRMAACAIKAEIRPSVIVSASATGYYGDRADETITEESSIGRGFLASTTATWETTWEAAQAAGIRVALLRLGVVLAASGGALKVMTPAFKAGIGGPLGSGNQWMPWITVRDAARLALFCAETEALSGPVNAASPDPVRQKDFARALGRAVHRPAVLPAPSIALRLLFGKMADETVLASCRALPTKAAESGFHFEDTQLQPALVKALGH